MTEKEEILQKSEYGFADLVKIIRILRAPGGCPWDRAQTHSSIRANLIEETYELVEGIDKDDKAIMREELGDVLLQILLHADMSAENGEFDIGDVINDICKKLILRHEHVFGNLRADDAAGALAAWDSAKMRIKGQHSGTEVLGSVSRSLPALVRADKIGAKARRHGFDFATPQEAFSKVHEELAEAEAAVQSGSAEDIAEEFGDLLLSVTCAARLAGADSEKALYDANEKFIARFSAMEAAAGERGETLAECAKSEKLSLWAQAKSAEKRRKTEN